MAARTSGDIANAGDDFWMLWLLGTLWQQGQFKLVVMCASGDDDGYYGHQTMPVMML
jgi:hypothetical protein